MCSNDRVFSLKALSFAEKLEIVKRFIVLLSTFQCFSMIDPLVDPVCQSRSYRMSHTAVLYGRQLQIKKTFRNLKDF